MRDTRMALLAFAGVLAVLANRGTAHGEASTGAEMRVDQLYRLAEADRSDSKKVHAFCRALANRYEQEAYSYSIEYDLRTCRILGFDKPSY